MKKLKNNIDCIIALIFVIMLAVFKTNTILYLYFLLIMIMELYYLFKRKYEKIIKQIIMFIPIIGIMSSTGIPLGNIYISVFSIFILLFEKKIAHSKNIIYTYIIFILIEMVRYCLCTNNINSISSIVCFVIFYLSLYCGIIIYEFVKDKDDKSDYGMIFIKGVLLSIIYGFITRYLNGGLSFALINNSILTRNSGGSGDPNYYGMYICVATSLLLILKVFNKKKNFAYISLFIFMIFMGLSSSSRMYYVLASINLIILAVYFIKNIFSRKIFKILLILLIILFIIIINKEIILENISFLSLRLNDSDITNGRSHLIEQYNNFMSLSYIRMLIGIGIPQYNLRASIDHYAHNFYVELYVTQGLTGIIVLFIYIIRTLPKILKNIKLFYIIPFVIFFIGGLGVSYIEVDSFYSLFFMLLAMAIKKGEKDYEKN